MGIFTYIKIGAVAVALIVCSYFIWNYQHLQKVNAAQKIQIESLQEATAYYEKQPAIDQKTAEVNDEIKKAVELGDVERVRELYRKLREHQRTRKSETLPPSGDGGDDN